jgi:hypothetical protein
VWGSSTAVQLRMYDGEHCVGAGCTYLPTWSHRPSPHMTTTNSVVDVQDGTIEFQLKLTGILSTSVAPVDEVVPKHGVRVSDRVNATVHQVGSTRSRTP